MLVLEPGDIILCLGTALRHPLVAGKAKPLKSFVIILHACPNHSFRAPLCCLGHGIQTLWIT